MSESEVARLSTEAMMDGDAASRMLGMEVIAAGPGTALADTAFAIACNSRGNVTVASGFDVTFLESGRLDDERAVIAEFRGRSRATGRTNPAVGQE
jgi:acyl-CoA thioesterase